MTIEDDGGESYYNRYYFVYGIIISYSYGTWQAYAVSHVYLIL